MAVRSIRVVVMVGVWVYGWWVVGVWVVKIVVVVVIKGILWLLGVYE